LLIHPFVPYDPWRGAIALAAGGLDDALRDVQDAIERQGAVGVKLYPPMGFRATDNKELSERHPAGRAFPIEFEDAIRVRPVDPAKTPGEWLDDALAGLYDWCARNGVPIMAHTGPSHAGNGSPAYFNRAAPRHWRAVLARHEELKVNLGHFGGIWHWQEDGTKLAERVARCLRDTNDSQGVEDCNWEDWPAEVGRIMGEPRFAGRVFADMADVLLPPGGGTDRFIARFRSEFRDQPQITRGLMYGSDFPFTVMEGDFAGYRQNFEKAFRDLAPQGLGYDETRMNDIMCGNAARFLGLTRARGITRRGRTVDRLVDFHVRATLNEEAPEIRRTVPDEQRRQKAKRVIEGLLEPFLVEPDGAAVGPTQPPANPVARPRSRRARLGLAS
jgi:predicted TIM-barrel fold metal-dependent hydrolase